MSQGLGYVYIMKVVDIQECAKFHHEMNIDVIKARKVKTNIQVF